MNDDPRINELDKRLSIVETRQDVMNDDIKDIKDSQKESRALVIGTLITGSLSLIGIIVQLVAGG